MGVMNRFESMMQGIVEGSFGRIFRARLQPEELPPKLVRAMEDNLQHGQGGPMAPNVYLVSLSPRDYDTFRTLAHSQHEQIVNAVLQVAQDRGYAMATPRPYIAYRVDRGLVTGETRIEAQSRGARDLPALQAAAAAGAPPADATRSMSPAEAQALAQQAQQAAQRQQPPTTIPPAWLTLMRPSRGQPMPLTRPTIHIGRHHTNDVVVADSKVSRHHAEIHFENGQFMLYDLGSTNGVGINGTMTRDPVPLRNNDRITVGTYEFIFQRR